MADVEYARASDGTHVAYRVLEADPAGGARHDLLMVSGGLFPMELFEDEPGFARLLDGLRSFARVIVFDRRGIGLSDPIVDWDVPILEQWTEDAQAVFDAVEPRDAVVFAWDSWGVGSRFVARNPQRVGQLVLYEPMLTTEEHWEEWSAERIGEIRANISGEVDIL